MSLCGNRFLKVMCKFGTALAIIPGYDFDKNLIVRRRLYKLYTASWALVLVITVYWTHYMMRLNNIVHTGRTLMAFLLFIHECAILVVYLAISMGSAFWNMDKWTLLFQGFSLTEKYFNSRGKIEKSRLNHFGSLFIPFTLLMLSNCSYSTYVWLEADFHVAANIRVAVSNFVLMYIVYVKNTIIYSIALIIKSKYQDLNNLLLKGCLDGRMDKMMTFKRVSYLYGLINRLVRTFNKLFGWEILLGLLHASISILLCFNHLLTYYNEEGEERICFPTGINVTFITTGIMIMVGQVQVMFSCHCAKIEAEKIIGICYKYQQRFEAYSREKLELLVLAHRALHDKPAFCAAGFFEINRNTLFALLGTTTTYLIVIIQFNQK